MTCNLCREACFHENRKERAARAHAATPSICGCEAYSVSSHSPGPVDDREQLHFVVSDPKSLLNGSLNPTALTQIDYGGLSVLRESASDTEFKITINQLKERANSADSEWFFFGVCSFTASTIRTDNNQRFLCVYDTGLPDKPNHADIMGPNFMSMSQPPISKREQEKQNRARIKKMIDKIGPVFTSASRFRSGIFAEYSRQTN